MNDSGIEAERARASLLHTTPEEHGCPPHIEVNSRVLVGTVE